MKRTKSDAATDAWLARLAAARAADDATATRVLRDALGQATGPVVARAATIAMERGLPALGADLAAAVTRLLQAQRSGTDYVGCREAIAALYDLGWRDPGVALAALDAAPDERGHQIVCGMRIAAAVAAAHLGHPAGMPALAELLGESDPSTRIAAARGLGSLESPNVDALLRLKVLCGDPDLQVTYECLTALARVSGPASQTFFRTVARGRDPRISEQAALALGEVRAPWGVDVLHDAWKATRDADLRRTFLLSIAMIRTPPGIELLLSLVREGLGRDACDAVDALAVLRDDPAVRESLLGLVRRRDDAGVEDAVRKAFGVR
jgi:HEAT repeat protein